mmetsp:Transcript_3724/g.13066  ORF Transcript_3724/g.13066 Transcript_3724/m.13066 type:complete len:226 (+) Transcript_3724:6931-7608(+)
MLLEPAVDQRDVNGPLRVPAALVEGPWGPPQLDGVSGVLRLQGAGAAEGGHPAGQDELLVLLVTLQVGVLRRVTILRDPPPLAPSFRAAPGPTGPVGRDRMNERVVVVRREVRVVLLDVHAHGLVKRPHSDLPWPVVVQVGEGHLVLSPDGLPDDELVDVVELVPVLVPGLHVPEKGLELGPPRHAHVQGLGGDKVVPVEKVEVVLVREVGQQLRRQAVQVAHNR